MKKRKVDEEESKLFTNYCDYGKNDLVDQEGEGGGCWLNQTAFSVRYEFLCDIVFCH